MFPTVEIAQSCLDQVASELTRVAPREGLAVPLVWLSRRPPEPGPTATLHLAHLEKVVIAGVVLVPAEKQLNSGFRVGVLGETDGLVAQATKRLTRRHPRLRACAYLHSHPFARGSTWPSRGARCDYEGHMLPLLERGLQAGLATSFSVIACRPNGGDGWKLQTFALDDERRIVDLGFAQPIPDDHPDVARALLPALSRRRGARLVRAWLHKLRRASVATRVDELFDGWLRIIAGPLVALVPPGFPDQAVQLFRWDPETNAVSPLESRALSKSGALLELVRSLEEEVSRERAQRLLPEGASADRAGA
ncbi:MAG TPA: hypothetical protein VGK67_17275 [Myxococcales bacterium]